MSRRAIGAIQIVTSTALLIYFRIYGTPGVVVTLAVFLFVAFAIVEFALYHHDRQASKRDAGK
jgi:hypothetical protein